MRQLELWLPLRGVQFDEKSFVRTESKHLRMRTFQTCIAPGLCSLALGPPQVCTQPSTLSVIIAIFTVINTTCVGHLAIQRSWLCVVHQWALILRLTLLCGVCSGFGTPSTFPRDYCHLHYDQHNLECESRSFFPAVLALGVCFLLWRSIGTHSSSKTLSHTLSCFRIIRRMRLSFENPLKMRSALSRALSRATHACHAAARVAPLAHNPRRHVNE